MGYSPEDEEDTAESNIACPMCDSEEATLETNDNGETVTSCPDCGYTTDT